MSYYKDPNPNKNRKKRKNKCYNLKAEAEAQTEAQVEAKTEAQTDKKEQTLNKFHEMITQFDDEWEQIDIKIYNQQKQN